MKGKDFIGVAGILIFAATFLIDQAVTPLPNTLYIILVSVSLVLLAVGMVFANQRRKKG